MDKKEIVESLPKEIKRKFLSIFDGKILGATKHIQIITEIICDMSEIYEEEDLQNRVIQILEYFRQTRGLSSYAIVTALNKIQKGFDSESVGVKEYIHSSCLAYNKESNDNVEKIVKYAKLLSAEYKTIMVYDYSSTVEKFVLSMGGILDVYVPESRAIDGGRPFLESFSKTNHHIHFIPDAAILTVLGEIDAVFIGAETFYPDGTAFNTVGSDILAELCSLRKIPFFVLTPLIKLDIRSKFGIFKKAIRADLRCTLQGTRDLPIKDSINCNCIELVGVNPKNITSFVTEVGIIPTESMYLVSSEYDIRNNGGTKYD